MVPRSQGHCGPLWAASLPHHIHSCTICALKNRRAHQNTEQHILMSTLMKRAHPNKFITEPKVESASSRRDFNWRPDSLLENEYKWILSHYGINRLGFPLCRSRSNRNQSMLYATAIPSLNPARIRKGATSSWMSWSDWIWRRHVVGRGGKNQCDVGPRC